MGRTKLALVVPFLFLVACGGGGGGGSGPVDQETAADYCQQGCDRELECDPTTDVNMCVSDCVDDVSDLIREDVFIAVTDCETALACDATSNSCFVDNCSPTSTHTSYETHCREALAQCDLSADQLDGACETTPAASDGTGDGVGYLCALVPSIISELDACFDEPDCVAIANCYDEVAAAHGL